jgi:hypothetical protein
MAKGEIYLDITGLKASQNDGAYVRMFLRRNSEVSRKLYLRFGSDGLSCWKALRALANVSRGQTRFLEFVDGRSHRVVKMVDFHPRVAGLAAKQKLSRTERNRLRRLKSAVKLRTVAASEGIEHRRKISGPRIGERVEHHRLLSDAPPGELFQDNIWPAESERDKSYGDSRFPGNCSGTVCIQCLRRYTKVGDTVLDPMAGSGTFIDAATALKRKCIAFDINPRRDDIRAADARRLPLENESVDFVFIHPPYSSMYEYSDPPIDGDLSAMKYEDFLHGISQVFKETIRVLRPRGFAAVLIGDLRKRMKFYDMPSEFSNICRSVGLELHDKIVKPTVHERSKSLRSIIVARRHNFHLIKFETLLVFRKPSHGTSTRFS